METSRRPEASDTTVCVGTFGEHDWIDRAQPGIESARLQAHSVIHIHGKTLAEARNEALERVKTPRVVFLDADDVLDAGFMEAMSKGSADIRVPSIKRTRPGRKPRRAFMPQVWSHKHDCTADCLTDGSWVCIGAHAPTDLIRKVGGFEDEWPVYEDWQLWLKCHLAGASFEPMPKAMYLAEVNDGSRNHSLPVEGRNEWHHMILASTLERRFSW